MRSNLFGKDGIGGFASHLRHIPQQIERIRPMAMIGLVDVVGLFPVMWATGTGADVMKRIAAPQVGGVFSAMILTLFVIPPVYVMWRWWKERRLMPIAGPAEPRLPDRSV